MRIERLEIAGFKSFAEPVTLEFGQGATAVVGPNGCGKSNIADAVFWVLGELGAGTIRARGKELIFSGSALREPLGVAEVRLHVSGVRVSPPGQSRNGVADNGSGALSGNGAFVEPAAPSGTPGNGASSDPLADAYPAEPAARGLEREVMVSRRVDASGQSVYEMDGRRCTRRDIRRLFAGTGLGPGSYALIEQGRANEVLSRKPADLRLLVEEAVGLGAYRLNRRESEANLRAAGKALERVRERLAELDRYIRVARRDSRTASRVREAADRARLLGVAEKATRRDELLTRIRQFAAPEEALGAERVRRSRSLATFERFVEAIREQVTGTEVELREATREIGDLGTRRARAAAILDEGARAAEVRATQVSRLETEAATLGARLDDLESEREESERRAGQFPERLAELTGAAAGRATARDRALAEERDAHSALWELRREADRLRANARSFRMSREQYAAQRERLSATGLGLSGSRRELDARLAHATQTLSEALSRVRAQEEETAGLRERLGTAEASWRSATSDAEAAREEEERAAKDQAAVSDRHRSLKALLASRDQLGESVSKLARAADRRGLTPGSALGELVEVDPGYELAAERLLGVHRIRIDRVADLSELVEEIGGADAVPSEVLVSELLEVCASPERVSADGDDRLSDHLRPVDPVLDPVIPDAVVTADLHEALSAFLDKPRLYVTRDGASVAPPGVVRFGRGGPGEGFLRTRREVAELEDRVRKGTRRLTRLARVAIARGENAEGARRAVEDLRETLGRAENLTHRLRFEADRREDTVEDVRQRIEELEAEASRHAEEKAGNETADTRAAELLARDEARLREVSRELGEREAAHAALKRELEVREEQWRDADRELARQNAVAEEVEGRARALGRQAREDRQRLDRIRVERAAARREQEEWRVRRESAIREQESTGAAIQDSEAREQALTTVAAGLRTKLESAVEALRLRGVEIRDLEERLHEVRSGTQEAKGLLRELESDFQRASGRSLADAAASLPAALRSRPREKIADEIREVEERIERLGPVNEIAEARLRDLEAERSEPELHLRDVERGISDGLAAIRRQDREARRIFREGFEAVSAGFDEAFRQLFGGGRAELRLVEMPGPSGLDESRDPAPGTGQSVDRSPGGPGPPDSGSSGNGVLEGTNGEVAGGVQGGSADTNSLAPEMPVDAQFGVEIAAQPPGKKLQSVRLLSGGEKAMTAIAFLIALFRYRPAPFCLLDEVDAPLDDANVQRFASMLGELKRDTQLVVITHNRLTMEACEHLYGVTMEEPGVSRLISVEIGADMESWIAAATDSDTAGSAAAISA